MRWTLAAVALWVGCGGSKRNSALDRAEAQRPKPPYEVRSVRGYTAPATCGQGPYRIEAAALGAKFGEQLEVNICAPRSLQGDIRFTAGGEEMTLKHFGVRNNSSRCKPTDAESARVAAGGDGGGAASGAGAAGGGPPQRSTDGSSTSPRPATASIALVPVAGEVGDVHDECPGGLYLTGIVSFYMESASDSIPWEAGLPLVVDFWSTEPLDLDGAMFVVSQRAAHTDMTLDTWTAYRSGDAKWVEMWNATLAGEVNAGRAHYAQTTATSTEAPPPPRDEVKPPSPSVHAEWIAGFWKREGEWIWSAGFWRVPDSDITAEQTVQAPVAPPPPKAETTPAAPSASASFVWTPGYWAWSGSAYIWIDGAWRIPPKAEARWVAPTWTARKGRHVLVPGGWSVNVQVGH